MQELAQLQRQLASLPDERECKQEEERLSAELRGLEKALEYQELDLKRTQEQQQKHETEVRV